MNKKAFLLLFSLTVLFGCTKDDKEEYKFVFFLNNGQFEKVESTPDLDQAYLNLRYYIEDIREIDVVKHYNAPGFKIPVGEKVKVLNYTKDSLIAQIEIFVRSELRGGMEYYQKGYVPYFCVHDTLPKKIRKEMKRKEMGYD